MKTEVILTSNIVGLGGESDQVKVAAGYARNYLLPQGLAIPVTQANKRRLEALKQRRAEREAHEFNTMSELAKGVTKLICVIKVKTGEDGKMFGTVTTGMIADELKHQFDITLDKRKIHLPHPIRTLGEQEVELRLHHDVNSMLKLRVESTTPLPAAAEAAAPEGRVSEKRGRGRQAEASPAEENAEASEKKPKAAKAEKAPKAEKPAKKGKADKAE
jgi:large subunit ribosomal protein L9